MCYSAQIKAEYKKFVRMFGALMSLRDFARLYQQREVDARIKIPKSMDALFMAPQSDLEVEIRGCIAEIPAAGHDRCIIPIRPEHVDAWLRPDRKDLAAQYAILDDRERPFYEHRLAA